MAVPSTFPNYMQMPRRLPIAFWRVVQAGSVLATLAVCYLLVVYPEVALPAFWGVVVPLLPLVFFLVPGLWRNICPLGATNQAPRLLNISREGVQPRWLKEYAYVVGIVLFFGLVSSRKLIFNTSAEAVAVMILGALTVAFLGGVLFKGKSGWCSSICPILPVQRVYGQTPWLTLPNSHCQPCLGCTKNCYDFNPGVAYIADQYDDDRHYSGYRRFFVAVFPGFILGFYLIPNPPEISVSQMYLQLGTYMLVSIGSFHLLDSFLKISTLRITTLYAAAAFNIYYWFSAPVFVDTVAELLDRDSLGWIAPVTQAAIAAATILWIGRTYRNERQFVDELTPISAMRVGGEAARALDRATARDSVEVTFDPDNLRVGVEPGRTLLEIIETNSLPIEAGCRMGMCGADPVTILEGAENLSEAGADELSTIQRLGLGEHTRMACCARVKGNVGVSLQVSKSKGPSAAAEKLPIDREIGAVVVIGNGIAGITAADHIRRNHPDCAIHVIGREKYHLYNRMAISRLIYGRSAMQGLSLMPESWYEERNITCWLNTRAVQIDREGKKVRLGVGEDLKYDRLILAMGSASFVPPVQGFGMEGTFVLREAEDAMHIRAFAQDHRCKQTIVSGGGLLGLEAAFALHQFGLDVTVLERGDWLLRRQLDDVGANVLQSYLESLGIDVQLGSETVEVEAENDRVARIQVRPEASLECDLFLMCAGITPTIDLASDAEITTGCGVVVDEFMRTSDPMIFAAGDVAECDGTVYGLWPAAVKQAEIAALNALGGNEIYAGSVPETMLKVAGIDLMSIGRFEPKSDDDVVIAELDGERHTYRKVVLSENRTVGTILIGHTGMAPVAASAIRESRDMSNFVEQLQNGDWSVFEETGQA
jgi:nitrite reductase (NADH) large subunit